jgi:3-methyladenine DNA glycosylase/8-oxoguanine DNA glycosylase
MYCGSADVALRSAVNHYFLGQDGRCSAEETDAIFQRYDDYAGVMSFYTLLRWAHEKY